MQIQRVQRRSYSLTYMILTNENQVFMITEKMLELVMTVFLCRGSNVSVKGVSLEQRDQSQQRMDGGLFHFLLLFMTKPDTDRTEHRVCRTVRSRQSAAVDTLHRRSFMFPESLTQPVRNQFLPKMKLFDKKSYLWETAGMGEGNTMWKCYSSLSF